MVLNMLYFCLWVSVWFMFRWLLMLILFVMSLVVGLLFLDSLGGVYWCCG